MADDRLTRPGPGDVRAHLDSVQDERRRADVLAALELMPDVTGVEPVMWVAAEADRARPVRTSSSRLMAVGGLSL